MHRLLVLLALALAACDPAADAGRRGNAALAAQQPAEALGHYDAGLSGADTTRGDLRARLYGNSALAEIARDSAAHALDAADRAAAAAESNGLARGALYHGGIASAALGNTDDALARFRGAVLLDGAFADASYNWEAVARQRGRSGGEGGGTGDAPKDDKGQTPPKSGEGADRDGDGKPDDAPGETPPPDPQSNPDGRRPGDDPSETPPGAPPSPSAAPPTISQGEAERLLDAVGRDEARLMRRTVRGAPSASRRTRDW